MPKAIWNGQVIADAHTTVMVEGNHYFPPESIDRSLFRANDRTTRCPWKGTASYVDLVVGDEVNAGAGWTYAQPLPEAANIKDHYAFWRGVTVEA